MMELNAEMSVRDQASQGKQLPKAQLSVFTTHHSYIVCHSFSQNRQNQHPIGLFFFLVFFF